MTATTLLLLLNKQKQQQQQQQQHQQQPQQPHQPQQQQPSTLVAVPENDCSNSYIQCDEEQNGTNIITTTTTTNKNIISPPVALKTTERQRDYSPWYNQRLVITIPIGQSIPHRPKELLVIPEDLWVEFYLKVQEAAAAAKNNNSNNITTTTTHTSATDVKASRVCCACCFSYRVYRIAIMLSCIGVIVILVLRLMGIIDFAFVPLFYLYLIGMCLRVQKSRIDFDEQHGAGIQAVCSHYSPVFEVWSNYFVEYKNYKSGLQFRQKVIRQFEQQSSNDPLIAVV